MTLNHHYYMQRAIELAKKGQYTTRPNPCVGCVIVKDHQIVGEGYHYQAGQPHAEVFALQQAKEQAQGATVYVTLEPCSHFGKTPPCVNALIAAGVAQVVIAVTDPNPKVFGKGIAKLRAAGIQVITGIGNETAYQLNQGFLYSMTHQKPYVRLKIACSLDGRIAMQNGESQWITSELSREDVQKLRAKSGAIITGSQTVLTDQPKLNVRSQTLGVPLMDIPQPRLVVLDRQQRIDLQSRWYQQQKHRLQLIQDPQKTLSQILQDLQQQQIHDVLVEAGARLSTSFLQQNLVNELIIYQAPCFLGETAQPMIKLNLQHIHQQMGFQVVSRETIGNDLKWVLTFP